MSGPRPGSELHHDRKPQSGFIVSQVRAETCCRHTGKARRWGQQRTWHEQRTRYDSARIRTGDYAWKSIHAWSYPAAPRPVRDIRMTIPVLSAERDVLPGHPVESE